MHTQHENCTKESFENKAADKIKKNFVLSDAKVEVT